MPISAQQSALLLALMALLLPACNGCSDRTLPLRLPDDAATRYAATLCAAEAACGCQHYASVDECESDVVATFELATVAISNFDEACFEDLLAEISGRGCVKSSEFAFTCAPITGATPVGASCERDPRVQSVMPGGTCEAGALCDIGTGQCSKAPSTPVSKAMGDPCTPHHLPSCGSTGLYCSPNGVCEVQASEGESCEVPGECAGAMFCATDTAVCTPRLEPGQPCNPLDWNTCGFQLTSETALEAGWCNPETSICEVGVPYVCASFNHPFFPR